MHKMGTLYLGYVSVLNSGTDPFWQMGYTVHTPHPNAPECISDVDP